jgi:hypothetical protein
VADTPSYSAGAPAVDASVIASQDSAIRIDRLAREAFDCFYYEMNNMSRNGTANQYENNRNWKQFIEIARTCDKNNWDPSDYVTVVFRSVASNGGFVLPCNLTTAAAKAYYKREKDRGAYSPQESWTQAEMVVAELVTSGCTEKQVLGNPMISLPAWFRVTYPEGVDNDLISRYGQRAKSELARHDVLEFATLKNRRAVETVLGEQTNNQQPC